MRPLRPVAPLPVNETDCQPIMRRAFFSAISVFGWCLAALAYVNDGVVTNALNIDAVSFVNTGVFVSDPDSSSSQNDPLDDNAILYSPHDTLYYTNTASGIMVGQSGFGFVTLTTSGTETASNFVNLGAITAVDTLEPPETVNTGQIDLDPGSGVPTPSRLQVQAANIFNQGTMTVGNVGVLQLIGNNVAIDNGALIAGDPTGTNIYDETSTLPIDEDYELALLGSTAGDLYYFVAPPSLQDLYWGVTNNTAEELGDFAGDFPETQTSFVHVRGTPVGLTYGFPLPISGLTLDLRTEQITVGTTPDWATYVFSYRQDNAPTNFYYNVVFVNTNFADSNISCQVGFIHDDITAPPLTAQGYPDANAREAVVQFSVPFFDVITGQVETNAVYLQDTGAANSNAAVLMYTNTAYLSDYARPNWFAVSTRAPAGWPGLPANSPKDVPVIGDILYLGFTNTYENTTVSYSSESYGVQVGWDPEEVNGVFPFTEGFFGLLSYGLDLPLPTNAPARIDIEANQLDLTGARLRSEGFVTLQASNLAPGSLSGNDWGSADAILGAKNGVMVISNVFPSSFQRIRGDVFAWAANWVNVGTNAFATNNYTFHVLVVDQSLRGNFTPSVRNLALTAAQSVTLADQMTVLNQSLIVTTNLTINNNLHFTQNDPNLTSNNLPDLENLFITTNGSLTVDNLLDLGVNSSSSQTSVGTRTYSINSITNLGQITAISPSFQAQHFESDGSIVADTNGSIVIEAGSLGLGLTLTSNAPNYLLADANVTLSAETIGAVNSTIYAGRTNVGQLILDTTPTGTITDFVPGDPSTNTVLTNFWKVTSGFSLLTKPATGDLFGTEITTIATGFNVSDHVWAGTDFGNSVNGFINNVVIGHLKLSRQSTNATLVFSGAGTRNGMYVDYLELDPNSYSFSDFGQGLVIDSNLTIYFANANVDPTKLQYAYPNRLVWITNFAGPNSTAVVPFFDSTNVCMMNAALANSQETNFFADDPGPNYALIHDYGWPYILNDYNAPHAATLCPVAAPVYVPPPQNTNSSSPTNVATVFPTISVNGRGHISPNLKPSQIVLGKTYALTAVASNGWLFSGWETNEAALTNGNVLKIALELGTALVANFEPNPYVDLKGVYHGLFFGTNGITPGSSGFVTLALAESGAFSGRLMMGPQSFSFSSKLGPTGLGEAQAKGGSVSLTLNLTNDLVGLTGRILGGVTSSQGWNSQLSADLAPRFTGKNASLLAGKYTGSFPWASNGVNIATGDSYVAATVSKSGIISAVGGLSDGTTFSQVVPLSSSGLWPFYAYVASGKDLIMGWVLVSGDGLMSPNVTWSKAANTGLYYKAGLTNSIQMLGSTYLPPPKDTAAIDLITGTVILSGADLTQSFGYTAALENNIYYVSPAATLKIQDANGTFSGEITDPETGKTEKASGVVLQNMNTARGFFLVPTAAESGGVLLQGD
jgi:hypothetical protein